MIEVAVLCDDVVGSGGDGAVHKLVVVLVDVAKKMKAEVGFAINNQWMMRDGFNNVVGHSGRGMLCEDFFVLRQYLVTDAQAILARQEVSPYTVVLATCRQRLDEGVSIKDYKAHRLHWFICRACAGACHAVGLASAGQTSPRPTFYR